VYTSTFSANVPLGPGTYYLNFSNSNTAQGNFFQWDANGGIGCAGVGCPTTAYSSNFVSPIDSESFSIYGLNPIPEPSTVLDIFGSGVFASLGLMFNGRLRQKLFRQ
jgi:hypothetical protein